MIWSLDWQKTQKLTVLCYEQAWLILRNRGKKPIIYDLVSIQFRLESIQYEIRKSWNITENFDSISDFIYACFQKNWCYFDIIEI